FAPTRPISCHLLGPTRTAKPMTLEHRTAAVCATRAPDRADGTASLTLRVRLPRCRRRNDAQHRHGLLAISVRRAFGCARCLQRWMLDSDQRMPVDHDGPEGELHLG